MAMDELGPIQPNVGGIQPSPVGAGGTRPQDGSAGAAAGEPFDVLLREQLLQQQQAQAPAAPSIKFSTHAQQRLQQRDITLDDDDVAKINQAVDRASEKGAKE